MKKIIFLSFVFILIFQINFSFALEDNSPPEQPVDYSNQIAQDPAIQSQLSQINGSLANLETKIDSKASKEDLEGFRQAINADINARNDILMSDIVVLLLVFTVFFFATFFLAIAKGWLVNGK